MSQDTSLTWTIERRIPSDYEAGHSVLDELLSRLQAENWSSRAICGIRLAFEEAIVNAIKHGNCLDCNKHVHVHCRSTPEKIWIQVTDQGSGFQPENVPDCTDPEYIDRPNGRGIMLMRHFMNFVEYSESGKVVTMEKLRIADDEDDEE